ncbi:uncharacterized protein ATNIH1004_008010 [Aspergillus tanneri]|uniref:MOSC domain-containing protein n=1 Tax=Aspergillus tanneri TaxID=1220188 RepID=A0A5M9MVT1_9EURO|nr:uncharacterized protein ATNIH1004_008010 [Aspergillus tanneri]KAA8646577.1 hypothetical protein ATNIH1004_008010 [Aspergillus tanneri]
MLDTRTNPFLFFTNVVLDQALYWICFLPVIVFLLHQLHCRTPTVPKGCRRLGLPLHQSNLKDEYKHKYSQKTPNIYTDENGHYPYRIKALFTYPIKSCSAIELDTADVVPAGFMYDRQFCFAEYITPKSSKTLGGKSQPQWTLRTLRDGEFSRMVLIRPEIWIPDPTSREYRSDLDEVKSEGVMIIFYPRIITDSVFASYFAKLGIRLGLLSRELSFRVPLTPSSDSISSYPLTPVKIFSACPMAYDYGQHIPQALRGFLCASNSARGPITLFRECPSYRREVFRCAPRKEKLGFQPVTRFADVYPINLMNLASVHDVASRCVASISRLSIRRFRANIIIQGPSAFVEDSWKRIRIQPQHGNDCDGIEIYTVSRTMRCKLPNVDPDTGIRHPTEPDRTLRSYRRIDQGDPTNACLGMQLVPTVRG